MQAPLLKFMAPSLATVILLNLAFFNCKLDAQQQFYYPSDQKNASSSFMRLALGFNLSISASYNTSGMPISDDRMFTMGTPNLDMGLFFPILSSASFNSSSTDSHRPGFSLGFYLNRYNDYMYVAVCAGALGRRSNSSDAPPYYWGPGLPYDIPLTTGGFAVPVWVANLERPIKSNAERASLVVVELEGADARNALALQLKDGDDQVVWTVPNVGVMEMRDSGEFLIYESITRETAPVFQQNPITDTLVEGQRLTAGMQLTSNDSAYYAKMEKGGLALYLNSTSGLQALPYWAFPFFRDPNPHELNPTIDQLLSSAPCSNMSEKPYLDVTSDVRSELTPFQVTLSSGSCSSVIGNYTYSSILRFYPSWSFVRLESDGRLYLYAVSYGDESDSSQYGTVRYALDSDDIAVILNTIDGWGIEYTDLGGKHTGGFMGNVRQECDVPLACGPLGVCTSGVKTPCSCPDDQLSSFKPNNMSDLTQGCKRRNSLPSCSTPEHNKFTSFVMLNSTASMFFINGWALNSSFEFARRAGADACKQACSIDCSCVAASYQFNTSSCFLMTSEITLFSISNDINAILLNYTAAPSLEDPDTAVYKRTVYANDYVTYLKVGLTVGSPDATKRQAEALVFYPQPISKLALIGIIPASVVVCFLLGLGGYHLRRRRRHRLQQAKEEEGLGNILPLLPARFSYRELQEATKGFSKLLGAGGCGSVYAGTLLDGRKVAVKVLLGVLQGSQSKDFLAEVAAVGRTGHHNIIRLVGFCWQVSHRLLVYEYAERGSLDRWLFEAGDMLLDWPTRYNIALGVARGLHYLHEECEQPILHFDIKPQNILLNDAFVAKLADFGMSRLMQRDMSSVMTGVRGTPGYIAPEWFFHGMVSKKSDIYSMGMVMMEIVAGRKVLEYAFLNSSSEQEAWHLPSLVASKCREQDYSVEDVVDKRLHACGFDEVQAQRLLHTALWCSQEDPAVRPRAATVVQWLENSSSPIQQPPIVWQPNS